VWKGYPVEGEHNTCWLTGIWSTQARVESAEGCMALGSNSSVI